MKLAGNTFLCFFVRNCFVERDTEEEEEKKNQGDENIAGKSRIIRAK